MSSAPRSSPRPAAYPLVAHPAPEHVAAYRRGNAVTSREFLADVLRVADALPDARHVLNVCADRYRFAVLLCAAICRGQVTLLPAATTPNVIRGLRDFAADTYYVGDGADDGIDLPRFELPPAAKASGAYPVPQIAADRIVACLFTSGSTGEPVPHFKTWGSLALDIAEETERFSIGAGHAVLGTVPPQHMYGFESTIILPLLSGAALTPERLFYPADIDAAIQRTPSPRVLFITPFHLRAWMESGGNARVETIISATAPLSVALAREAEERTGARVLEIYGCTEAGQIASRRPTQGAEWTAYAGLHLRMDADRATVFGGHVEAPTPLQDVIEILGDGTRFLLHGRLGDLVNIAGKRNSIGYLNHQLLSIPGVSDGVFYLPDDDKEPLTRLAAFVVAPGLNKAQIMAALRLRIDPAFLPRPLVLVDSLPRNLTGKLPRAALRSLLSARHKPGSTSS